MWSGNLKAHGHAQPQASTPGQCLGMQCFGMHDAHCSSRHCPTHVTFCLTALLHHQGKLTLRLLDAFAPMHAVHAAGARRNVTVGERTMLCDHGSQRTPVGAIKPLCRLEDDVRDVGPGIDHDGQQEVFVKKT